MVNRDLILKSIIYISGFLCLIIFILARFEGGLGWLINSEIDGKGDLYKQVAVKLFDEDLPDKISLPEGIKKPEIYTHKEYHPAINDADILTFGDSYFYFTRFTSLPEKLSELTSEKVYFAAEPNPFVRLKQEKYKSSNNKYLIYETGERGIYARFQKKFDINPSLIDLNLDDKFFVIRKPGEVEKIYDRFLQLGYITGDIYELLNTYKFNYFGYIHESAPVYSTDPPLLFYETTVNKLPGSYQYNYSEAEITNLVENINYMSNKLDSMYNLKLIFMPIPSKISIYDSLISWDEYNNLLPKLYQQLNQRGINYIDLYHPFKASDKLLFYGTDTHWNESGVDTACEIIINKYFKKKDDELVLEKKG